MLKKLILNNIFWVIEKIIPHGRIGDTIFAYYLFFRNHTRLPKNEMLFNDVLFRFKVSDQFIDPARTFTTDKELVKLYLKSLVSQSLAG